MKFDIQDHPGDVAMCCETEDEAIIFTQYLHSVGRTWASGRSYLDRPMSSGFTKDFQGVGYSFNYGCHGSIDSYTEAGYVLLWFKDFDWGAEYEELDSQEFDDFLLSYARPKNNAKINYETRILS